MENKRKELPLGVQALIFFGMPALLVGAALLVGKMRSAGVFGPTQTPIFDTPTATIDPSPHSMSFPCPTWDIPKGQQVRLVGYLVMMTGTYEISQSTINIQFIPTPDDLNDWIGLKILNGDSASSIHMDDHSVWVRDDAGEAIPWSTSGYTSSRQVLVLGTYDGTSGNHCWIKVESIK